jgi:hypothetical protein
VVTFRGVEVVPSVLDARGGGPERVGGLGVPVGEGVEVVEAVGFGVGGSFD